MIEGVLRFAVADLYARYAAHLDAGAYEPWLDLFSDDCRYVVQPRENYDAGLPLATVRLDSKAMLRDRIHAVTETIYHAPYYQRHLIGPPLIDATTDGAQVEANYLVIRTHVAQPSEVFNAGRFVDRLVWQGDRLKIADKLCIFDSELIPNSMIYPV